MECKLEWFLEDNENEHNQMEPSTMLVESTGEKPTIYDLPEEILEFILMKVSPYRDLKSASLVCHSWYRLVQVVLRKLHVHYHQSVLTGELVWSSITPDAGCRITERYSHACCYFDKSLYVFGGCTVNNTTLNDLWRFDLASREWIRPVAMGTYPFPKACASLVVYKDNLVLFGGWSHPTPFPLHQAARYFSELHLYKPSLNRWSQVTTLSHQSPQPVAGHSASIVGDLMVVFGGSQVPGIRTNEVWVFDLVENTWRQPRTSNRKPAPRYGHIQVTLDDSHVLILGGKGEGGNPYQVFRDCWLLTVGGEQWTWEEITVDNDEDTAPSQLWCHAACKVSNDMIVTLCKPAKKYEYPASPQQIQRNLSTSSRQWVPPGNNQSGNSANRNVRNSASTSNNESNKGNSASTSIPRNQSTSSSSSASSDSLDMDQSDESSESSDASSDQSETRKLPDVRTPGPRPGLPSIRPNAMKNRQRQLEALLKYEKRLRSSDNPAASSNVVEPERPSTSGTFGAPSTARNVWSPKVSKTVNQASLMVLHVLNISEALQTKRVQWQKLNLNYLDGAPEETIFYTLVEGRGELLMFGGIERDIHCLKYDYGSKSHTVNNSLHVLSPIHHLL